MIVNDSNTVKKLVSTDTVQQIHNFCDLCIDAIIDTIRVRHNIVIYNAADPYVDPISETHPIMFGYQVKKCFPGKENGWNHRIYIGHTSWSSDIWKAKEEAINLALDYIINYEK